MKIKVHLFGPPSAPHETTLEVKPGQSLMQAAVANDVKGIAADCGGMMTCATCHVYVREPFASRLQLPTADELGMLEFTASPRTANSRLSCQIKLTTELDGLAVDLPESQY
jgi:2Fe-2S ferredoxin